MLVSSGSAHRKGKYSSAIQLREAIWCEMILGAGGGGRGAPAMAPGHPGAVDMRVGDVRAWGSAERRGRRPRGAIGRRPYRGPYAREIVRL